MAQDLAYQALLAELQALQNPAPIPPQFSEEQVRQRIRDNNQQVNLGLLGELGGDPNARRVGGAIFKRALGDREERVTNRGTTDPLTGVTAEDPMYAADQRDARRGKVLDATLRYEDQRQRAADRVAQAEQERAFRGEQAEQNRVLRRAIAAQSADRFTVPKPPAGFRYSADGQSLEAIPGGPAALKNNAASEKARTAADQAVQKANDVSTQIDDALALVSGTTAGFVGNLVGKIPGTPAVDLQAKIDTIKANIGFQELQAMRMASPTGGALGQVAVQELNYLQATLGNLDRRQSPEQLEANLKKIKQHFTRWSQTMQQAAQGGASEGVEDAPGYDGSDATSGAPAAAGAVPARPGGAAPGAPSGARFRWNPATKQLEPAQ